MINKNLLSLLNISDERKFTNTNITTLITNRFCFYKAYASYTQHMLTLSVPTHQKLRRLLLILVLSYCKIVFFNKYHNCTRNRFRRMSCPDSRVSVTYVHRLGDVKVTS